MSKARLVITAIEVEGRSPADAVAAYGVSRSWLYELLARPLPSRGQRGVRASLQAPAQLPGGHPRADRRAGATDLHVRVIHAATGELLRDLVLDPRKDYQPTGRPPGPARPGPARPANDKRPNPQSVGSGVRDVLRHHTLSG